MQMHDALRQAPAGSVADALAASFGVDPGQAQVVLRTMAPKFAWALETLTLNRAGLADLVDAIGRIDRARFPVAGLAQNQAALAEGETLLGLMFPDSETRTLLAAELASRTGIGEPVLARMLPALALATVSAMATRVRPYLAAILSRMPALGRWAKGSPHADLADILRRGCGGGPHSPGALRRRVRWRVAQAGGFGSLGVLGWYVRYMLLRPARQIMRPMLGRMMDQA